MQFQTAVDRKIMILCTAKELGTTLARPSVTRIVANRRTSKDIDTTSLCIILMAEQVVLVCHYTENGYLLQAFDNLRA